MKFTTHPHLSAIALICLTLLTSCAKDAKLSTNGECIGFTASVGSSTKATAITTANIGSFSVTAIGNSANYFTDENVAVTSAGVCTMDNTFYWPGYELSFYAYANVSGGTASITNASKGIAGVTPVAAAASQQDFVVSYNTGTKAGNMASGVPMNFRHALSQVIVKAKNLSTSGLIINVKGVKVANVMDSGDFTYPASVTNPHNGSTLDFALWDVSGASKTAYSIGGTSETAVVLNGTAQSIMFGGASWMLVPQQLVAWNLDSDKTNTSANAYIGVLLQILDGASNQLYPATAGQYAYANVPIDTKWEPGKKYTYTLNFLDEANGGGAGVDDNGDPVLGSPINFTLTIDNWDGYIDYTANNGMTDLLVETPAKTTFGGLEIASGPLIYEGGKYVIATDWTACSFNNTYGENEGSTYFLPQQIGVLYEGSGYNKNTSEPIQNLTDPLDGWRLVTITEHSKLLTNSESVRPGSTVNGLSNKHYASIQISNPGLYGLTTLNGVLIFPDDETITGKTLNNFDNGTINTGITITEVNEYIDKGCAFIPSFAHYQTSWPTSLFGQNGFYLISTKTGTAYQYLFITPTNVSTSSTSNLYSMIRLVREVN